VLGERDPALGERALDPDLVVVGEHVERDQPGGRLVGQAVDPRLRRVDPLREGVEVLAAARVADDDLSIDDVAAFGQAAELGEVTRERLAVARLQLDLVTVHEDDRAEAVPLRLIRPAVALGQGLGRPGELRQEGRGEREHG